PQRCLGFGFLLGKLLLAIALKIGQPLIHEGRVAAILNKDYRIRCFPRWHPRSGWPAAFSSLAAAFASFDIAFSSFGLQLRSYMEWPPVERPRSKPRARHRSLKGNNTQLPAGLGLHVSIPFLKQLLFLARFFVEAERPRSHLLRALLRLSALAI